jgi:hypothetical protein
MEVLSMEKMKWRIPTERLEKFFNKDSREDYGIGLLSVFAWLLIYAGMAPVAHLSFFAVIGIGAIIFFASVLMLKLMTKAPMVLAWLVFFIFIAFTLIHLGLSHVA